MGIGRHLRDDLAEWWRRFWGQPNKAYRNFHVAFFLLGMHFLIPSFMYLLNPQGAIGQLKMMGDLLGAEPYPFSEDGFAWRVLAAGNVFTLAFMCFMIESNVKRFYAVLIPLCVLKGYSSLGYLLSYLFAYGYPPFLGIFIWDGTNVLMFLYFAHTAYWSLEEWGEESAVPGLFFRQQEK